MEKVSHSYSNASRIRSFGFRWLWRIIEQLPLVLPAALAAFSAVAIAFLLIGQFRSMYVWPVGLIAAVICTWIVLQLTRPCVMGDTTERRICSVLVVLGLVVWGSFNMLYSSQHVITDRDPATYAVAGAWLVHHDTLKIPISHEFGSAKTLTANSLGFSVNHAPHGSYVYAQGQHLLPALLGLAGRSIGMANMLRINVLFGVTALLATYGFARLLGRPRWALVITAALAVSMPFIYFSRDTYTEPLAATFTLGGLALLWTAQQTKRLPLWFLAGLVLGAGALTRIDAYLTFIGIAIFMVISLMMCHRNERRATLWQLLWLSIGLGITGFLGWLDVAHLAHPYYLDLHKEFYMEIMGLVLIALVGVVAIWLAWHTPLMVRLDKMTRPWRGSIIGFLTILFVLLLACRPFVTWYSDHLNLVSTVPSEHSYAEITTYWVSWYLGPILALLGLGGFALAAARAVIHRYNFVLVPGILVVTITCLVYLIRPNITPDQIWASRRLLPVILPGVAAFGCMALDWLDREFFAEWQFGNAFAGLSAVAIIIGALFVSSPLVLLRDTAELSPVQTSCARLPKNAAVLLVGMAQQKMMQPLHAFCGVPVAGYDYDLQAPPSATTLAQIAQSARESGKVLVIGSFGSDISTFMSTDQQASLTKPITFSYRHLEHTYLSPPQHIITESDSLYYGLVDDHGALTPLFR